MTELSQEATLEAARLIVQQRKLRTELKKIAKESPKAHSLTIDGDEDCEFDVNFNVLKHGLESMISLTRTLLRNLGVSTDEKAATDETK